MVLGGYNVANTGEPYNYQVNSISNNFIKYLYAPDTNISNYYWTNPSNNLIGLYGDGTSYWAQLTELIYNHTQENVYLMVHSLPYGDIDDWVKDRWIESVHQFVFGNKSYPNVVILWIEGENDNNFPFNIFNYYRTKWLSIYKRTQQLGNYSWAIASSTYSPYNYFYDEQITRSYLNDLLSITSNLSIFGGVNSDTLCQEYRYKYKYFNHIGQLQLVNAWFNSLFNRSKEIINPNKESDYYCNMRILSRLGFVIMTFIILIPIIAVGGCIYYMCVISSRYNRQYTVVINHDLEQQAPPKYELPPKYTENEPLLAQSV